MKIASRVRKVMERVVKPANMDAACVHVINNQGCPGLDRMTVEQLEAWYCRNRVRLLTGLLAGKFVPYPLLGVQIPKTTGGFRHLGIPTVKDRLVQQAMAQVLRPILEPLFSDSSFAYRPGKGAHRALFQAREHVKSGLPYVVDIDIERFFDNVDHDILNALLVRQMADRRFLRLVDTFLIAGVVRQGVYIETRTGLPQGGPLSPVLSNLVLDMLDKWLEGQGHKFCRYADDCNIYVASREEGEGLMAQVADFLQQSLGLSINEKKSGVDRACNRKFLGYRLAAGGVLQVAPESLEVFKRNLLSLTQGQSGQAFAAMLVRVGKYMNHWLAYFKHGCNQATYRQIEEWVRLALQGQLA